MFAAELDGALVASKLLIDTAQRVELLKSSTNRAPCLATVLVGDDPASHTYVRMKANRCADVGIRSLRVELDPATTTDQLVRELLALSRNDDIDGILLQHPVPRHIDERAAFEAIAPHKDVDGVTGASFAATALGFPGFESCTPSGILRLLGAYDIITAGKHAVVIGRSPILGLPVGMMLLQHNATVTYCHSHTSDLQDQVGRADIVVAAVGQPELIRGRWIKRGAIVVDAGYNPGNVGDVEYAAAREHARWITPVPGGVGPMTIAVLLAQTADAAGAPAGEAVHLAAVQSKT
jgi:methylenetetrahydrofolate dehydrogenase (NADP+) / methenyltetrahydrofolate cyclohydrolase